MEKNYWAQISFSVLEKQWNFLKILRRGCACDKLILIVFESPQSKDIKRENAFQKKSIQITSKLIKQVYRKPKKPDIKNTRES